MSLNFATVRQSWRAALRRPAFLMLATSTLALGIGAATAVFALVDAVLLAPPPFAQPDRLVVIDRAGGHPWQTISPQQYQMLAGIDGIAALGAKYPPRDVNVAGSGDPELVTAWPVDAGFLPTLGIAPQPGRNFSADEDRPDAAPVAILGHAFWLRHFNGAADVVGRSVLIDGVASTIVGVLPAPLRLDGSPDLLIPLALPVASKDQSTNLLAIARLGPGAAAASVGAAVDTHLHARADELGFNEHWNPRFATSPLAWNFRADARPVLLLFLACAACVLLLVAVNLFNLMLLRALGRGHDSAVRAALGASGAQLALPAFGESLLIGVLGALAGLLLAGAALVLARGWLPDGWIDPDTRLLGSASIAFAFVAALTVALLAGLFGVWRGRSGAAARELAAGARGGGSVGAQRFSRSLVVAQASLASVLLTASALLALSLWKLSQVDLGFAAREVIVFRLNPAPALYPDTAAMHHFGQSLLDTLRAQPGVKHAALTTTLPISSQFNVSIHLPDGSSPPEAPQFRAVSTDSFATLGIPLIAGRAIAADDRPGSEPITVVSASFAAQWLGGDAIGKWIRYDTGGDTPLPPMRIVGVVGDVHQFGPQQAALPTFYVPLGQVPDSIMGIVRKLTPLNAMVKVSGPVAPWFPRLRELLRQVDARQGMAGLRMFERDVADATAPQRMNALLVGTFAILAILLATVGLYSVTAVAVASRRREFGVRAALGAAPARLLVGVIGGGLRDVGLGLAIGLAAVLAGGQLLESFLFGVHAFDPLTLTATLLVLLSAGLAATAVPALRAARTAPMTALRDD